jgi:hypothetical protein
MKKRLLRWMLRYYERRRCYISSYIGLLFAGALKSSVLGQQREAEREAAELAGVVGRADLLISNLKERVGMS